MTNYDLLKNMSIEELAVTIMCPNDTGMAEIQCDKSDERNCCQCCLDWLKEDISLSEKTPGQLSPPEIAEMHMDGTLCERCGEFIGDPVGYPRVCVVCEE